MLSSEFSGLLLAGGFSRRMGRDKATLELSGRPLWQVQLEILQALGVRECFISGPAEGPFRAAAATILPDETRGLGPLAGLSAGLRHCRTRWLVVLAIDLPRVPVAWLRERMTEAASQQRGLIPHGPHGFEPLAAIYPREALPAVERALAGGELSAQDLTRALIADRLALPYPMAADEQSFFTNVNTPEEWRALTAPGGVSRSAHPPSCDQ